MSETRGKAYHYEPDPRDRQYMRHAQSGDLGWLVRRGGEDHVRYDRVGVDQTVKVTRDVRGVPNNWTPVAPPAPLNTFQVAMIAYEANRLLDRYLGNVNNKKAWIDIDEDKRRDWLEWGPNSPGIRDDLYKAILKVGEKYTK